MVYIILRSKFFIEQIKFNINKKNRVRSLL
jgi:hypothetical protein